MSRKLVLIIIGVAAAASLVGYNFFSKKENGSFTFEEAARAAVAQRVSETGTVKISDKAKLSFKSAGKIGEIYAAAGDIVRKDQDLVSLDSEQLSIQLSQARAELREVREKKGNAQVSLDSAENELADAVNKANDALKSAYEDAVAALDDAYLKVYNAKLAVNVIMNLYFNNTGSYEASDINQKKSQMEYDLSVLKIYIDKIKDNPTNENIDEAILKSGVILARVQNCLADIRDIIQNSAYHDIVSSNDRAGLDTHRSNINTAISDIADAKQSISSTKAANEANITVAKAKVAEMGDQLRDEDNGLYRAQIDQAAAKVELLRSQMQDAVLKSPADGMVTEVEKKEGETVQPGETVLYFLPEGPFAIKVNIYEGDIIKVKVGDRASISLTAIPDLTFGGEVVAIDPAETIMNDVVYYEVTIALGENIDGIKQGMTADITIETNRKENVLAVPKGAVEKIDGKTIVKVLKNGKAEDREIIVGLKGDDLVEVVSGLAEGEKIVTGKK